MKTLVKKGAPVLLGGVAVCGLLGFLFGCISSMDGDKLWWLPAAVAVLSLLIAIFAGALLFYIDEKLKVKPVARIEYTDRWIIFHGNNEDIRIPCEADSFTETLKKIEK